MKKNMENELQQIQERNKRVEHDKAWEVSKVRRGLIAFITYAVAVVFMYRIGIAEPFLNALVPSGGYVLSTLSLPFVKRWWTSKYGK
mgnify:CR=1 FL=1